MYENHVLAWLRAKGYTVADWFNVGTEDEDIVFMVFAKTFVQGGVAFPDCVAKMNGAHVFQPDAEPKPNYKATPRRGYIYI